MSEQKKKIIFILCLSFLGIALISGIYLANIRYGEEVTVISSEEKEKIDKAREIESSIRKCLGFDEYSNNVFVELDSISGGKSIYIHYSMFEISSIFSDCCKESAEAVRNLIENNLIEWDFEKDELSIALYKIFEARRKDRGEKDSEKLFFMWKTHDLEKGRFVDFEKGYVGNKTLEELKNDDETNKKNFLEEKRKIEKFLKNR